jgi:hypothetical protein
MFFNPIIKFAFRISFVKTNLNPIFKNFLSKLFNEMDKLPTSRRISETAHRLIDLSKSNFYSMMVKNHLS